MNMSRRCFLRTAGAVSMGFSGLQTILGEIGTSAIDANDIPNGFGELISDPQGILDLPKGFVYQAISKTGDEMDDGFLVPSNHDGMAAFPGPGGTTILVRNHERNVEASMDSGPFGGENERFGKVDPRFVYDMGKVNSPFSAGTTTLVYDTRSRNLKKHFLSLIGTIRNCAGGPTPWKSWISCEETVLKARPKALRAGDEALEDHGYNFEVPATDQIGLTVPVPLKAMGRFNHEAIAVDPKTGIVYETEDLNDGLIYRFVPHQPGKLADGGRLQALMALENSQLDTRNWEETTVQVGDRLSVSWVDLEDVESPNDDLRVQGYGKGAAQFARCEGIWYGQNTFYIACTTGGKSKKGQVWQYRPSPNEGNPKELENPGQLSLFVEPNDGQLLDRADNLTVAPWGDLIICEDGPGDDYLVGVTPEGSLYKFGKNAMPAQIRANGKPVKSEFAGATFSPDGSTLFVNIQNPGITLAITGPWRAD